MNVSIGIMCYNEEKNIENILNALLNQKTERINIDEIIVVSTGCTDNTNKIVRKFIGKNYKIKLFIEKERKGKAEAINIFLEKAKNNILVLESADTLPEKNTIEQLCLKLKSPTTGIVSGRPIPIQNKNKLMHFIIQLQWQLHHEISKEKPKFGELIAFKKVFKKIPRTSVDEEEIASIIKSKDLKLSYEPKAIVYNKGPENIKEFIRQRRRSYSGHLELKKRTMYEASTMKSINIFKKLLKTKAQKKNIIFVTIAILLEGLGRFLGLIDYFTKKDHSIWKISQTTKKL